VDGLDARMPFNANTKYALSIVEYKKDESDYCILIKGAPEKLWKYCSFILQRRR
jgi:sodium/potassium-transporting ATPase subunit alpha